MGFFNSGLFWFIEGILACLAGGKPDEREMET
jgi:hypothetical protein